VWMMSKGDFARRTEGPESDKTSQMQMFWIQFGHNMEKLSYTNGFKLT
jgi:hypothetical protein